MLFLLNLLPFSIQSFYIFGKTAYNVEDRSYDGLDMFKVLIYG